MTDYQFHPDAETEHLETVAYYESQQSGLGAMYLSEFEDMMEQVCMFPARYPVERKPDIRRIRLRRFPFTVIFRESDGIIQREKIRQTAKEFRAD
jgi:hypothetical protein